MIGGVKVILLEGEAAAPPVAPTIIVVGYQPNGTVLIRVLTGWTRITFYYPDINGTVIYDTDVDGPPLTATIIDGQTFDNFYLDVPAGVRQGSAFRVAGTNKEDPHESPPTNGFVPSRGGGGPLGGGALVGFGGL